MTSNSEYINSFYNLVCEILFEDKILFYFEIPFIIIGLLCLLYERIKLNKDVIAKELWRIRNCQKHAIHQEFLYRSRYTKDAQTIIQFHYDYDLAAIGFNRSEEDERSICLFAANLPSIDEIDFEKLKKLNSYGYLEEQCQIKAGNLVDAIYEDEGYFSSQKMIKILSVTKEDFTYIVTLDLAFYGQKKFEFDPHFSSYHFKFIES